jgi:hypothetical protein
MRLVVVAAALLLAVRLPSLVQPMGADQALYAYIGDRILAGDLAYRDAWDQKPPAIHYTYALMRAIWADDAVVAAADLAAAGLVGWLVWRLGANLLSEGAGAAASLLFLLLSNPAFARVGGVRIRSQCETFIAVAITGAFLLVMRSNRDHVARSVAAGALFGVAFAFKYNAGIYAPAGLLALWLIGSFSMRTATALCGGFVLPIAAGVVIFTAGGALRDLYDATVTYNLGYASETYGGESHFVGYLLTFPVQQARNDALWTLGGAGCLLLLAWARSRRELLIPVLWVAAACIAIAVNGSRGYPQYFVQANPALALAAGVAGVLAWRWLTARFPDRARLSAAAAVVLIAVAVWRVNLFPKLVEQTWFDIRHAAGRIARDDYLDRFADERKYSARAALELAGFFRAHSGPGEPVFVFGFTCAAYSYADRVSASRFFWSRPVIVGFKAGRPGYGADGLLDELERNRPAAIALQLRDWSPVDQDSAAFFMSSAPLAGWLQQHYAPARGVHGFDLWLRRATDSRRQSPHPDRR